MSQSQVLYILQQVDSKLDQTLTRTKEIKLTLASNKVLEQAQLKVAEAQHKLDSCLQELLMAEQLVREQYVKIEQTEAALYGGKIRIPKELQDLQNEAESLKRYLLILEDRQLEHMETVEIAQGELDNAKSRLDIAEADWAEQAAQMHNELSQLQRLSVRLESERAAVLNQISPDLLSVYENLRKQRNGVAVVMVSGKSCSACGSTLTPAVMQSVQSSQTIIRCPSCNRILYSG